MVYEEKTEYIMTLGNQTRKFIIKKYHYKFERVATFKYIGVNIKENTDSHKVIKVR